MRTGRWKPCSARFGESVQTRTATREDKPGGDLGVQTGTPQIVRDERQKFLRARFDNVREHARKNRTRGAIADAGDFNGAVLAQKIGRGAPVMTLDLLGFGDGRAQANRQVVGEMIAANGHCAGVAHDTAAVDDQLGGATANIEQAAAQVAFILGQAGFRRGQRFEYRVVDEDAGLVCGGHQVLRCGDGRSNDMDVRFQPLADHADGIADAILGIHDELMRKNVQHFPVIGKRDVARGVNGAAHIVAFNVAGTRPQRDAAAAVHTANVAPGNANRGGFHGNVGDAFGFFHRAANGADRGVQIDDEPFAQPFGFRGAERQKTHLLVLDFRKQHAGLGAADIQPDEVLVFLCQNALLNAAYFSFPAEAEVSGFTTTCREY